MHTDRDTEQVRTATRSGWPEAMEQGKVGDTAFATAYARVSDRERAWIKTGIASIYAACGGPFPHACCQRVGLGHDLFLTTRDIPLDFAVVVCGPEFASPARLAAAVIPALCARVTEIAVLQVGGRWRQALLTTLELCGVEMVCRVGARVLPGLWEALDTKGRGAVVVLDGKFPRPKADTRMLRVLPAQITGRAGVALDAETAFDCDALTFAHPDMTFFLHGAAGAYQAPFHIASGALSATASGYDALYVGRDRVERWLGAAPLVLGPGRETFWLWPNLSPETFRRRDLAATVAVQDEESDAANDCSTASSVMERS